MPKVGFFTFAQGEAYLRCAYALALSLRATQPADACELTVGIGPRDKVPKPYEKAFNVVTVPWGDSASRSLWKLENEWKVIHMTPYEETVKLDADMLFVDDVSGWLPYMQNHDLLFTSTVYTHRGRIIKSDACRKAFTANRLPNIYSAFFYFKKTRPAYKFFELNELIFNNWQVFWREQLEPKTRPGNFSTDVAYAIAAKALQTCEGVQCPFIDVPTFTHMKGELQSWEQVSFDQSQTWPAWLPVSLTSEGDLYVGRFKQRLPFHYQVKTFVTDDMLMTLERRAACRTTRS